MVPNKHLFLNHLQAQHCQAKKKFTYQINTKKEINLILWIHFIIYVT